MEKVSSTSGAAEKRNVAEAASMINYKDELVLRGPKFTEPVSNGALGKILYDSLCEADFDRKQPVMIEALTGESISYEALLKEACVLAEALRRYGCNSETIISIYSENDVHFYISVLAGLFVGSIIAPINFLSTVYELNHYLNISESKIMFISKNVSEKFMRMKGELNFVEKIIVFNTEENVIGAQNIKEFTSEQLGNEEVYPEKFIPWNGECSKIAFLLSSSGTTGLPKRVMLSHKNFAVRITQSRHPEHCFIEKGTISGVLPLFHTFGLTMGITSIVNRNLMVLQKNFNEDVFLNSIEKYKINTLIIVPPLALILAKSSKLDNYDLSSLKEVLCGAAPLSERIENLLKERLNLRIFRQIWGQTESTFGVTMTRNDEETPHSCGKVVPGMKLKVWDPDTGKSLGPNTVGEVCVKGPTVMKGYYKNETATRESFTSDGWLRSGDLGYYDDNKNLYIIDRLKELIKYKGYQVAPAELESILLTHPEVLDAGVVGMPDELAGELPVAFVVKRTPDVTATEIQEYVSKHVIPQKKLRGGVIFVSSITKTASGKILRRELKLQLNDHKP